MMATYTLAATWVRKQRGAVATIAPVGSEYYEIRIEVHGPLPTDKLGTLTQPRQRVGEPTLYSHPHIAMRMAEDVLRCLDRGDDPASIAGWIWAPAEPAAAPVGTIVRLATGSPLDRWSQQ